MIRFAIIIPFRPNAESVNWNKESALLQQTIQSVLRQTFTSFKVFVVYTDAPSVVIDDAKVEYHEFPYGYKSYLELENREDLLSKFKSEKMVTRRWDKARKLCYGSKLAKDAGCDYIMALDADDLLSNRFLAYMAKDAQKDKRKGWFVEKGYLYRENSNYLVKVPKNMRFLNGSTHILHSDLVKIPDFASLDWLDYNLFTDHGWIKHRLEEYYGALLYPIPFPALVYVVHRSNISQVGKKEFGFNLKSIVKRILRGKLLTTSLREEFNII
ncbi:glycosyltransferase family A protein [Lacibacter sp.]|uniref:glycosyltransferase family A protein n=1 Tax=Lacibacter sp. TaxID=1915409 RepID=UPI002B4B6D70|nr:glycosyltransferase family A protein [Lacibacter sp.]HLP36083.1 glycosyltransferase family A protein [Lacibacter sp.]